MHGARDSEDARGALRRRASSGLVHHPSCIVQRAPRTRAARASLLRPLCIRPFERLVHRISAAPMLDSQRWSPHPPPAPIVTPRRFAVLAALAAATALAAPLPAQSIATTYRASADSLINAALRDSAAWNRL